NKMNQLRYFAKDEVPPTSPLPQFSHIDIEGRNYSAMELPAQSTLNSLIFSLKMYILWII
ncbi:MAG: hypothetical protein KBT13_09760, partial [Bacteroidales bacterium]|nr:hypothetical protein [Candidatus Sodaliphilus limicaballi]